MHEDYDGGRPFFQEGLSFDDDEPSEIIDLYMKVDAHRLKGESEDFYSNGQAPREFLSEFAALALTSTDLSALVNELEKRLPGGRPGMDWRQTLDNLMKTEGLDRLAAWALMLSWLADKLANDLSLSRQAGRLLRHTLATLDDSRRKALTEQLDSQFPSLTAGSWA